MNKAQDNINGGLFFIAIAIVVAAWIGGDAVKFVKRAGDTISVTGSAKMQVVSDFVTWRGNLQASGQTLEEASRDLLRYRQTVEAWLQEQNVPEGAISWQPLNIWEQREMNERGMETGRIVRFNAQQSLEVRSTEVDRIAEVSRGAEELLLQGIPFQPSSPEYTYTRLDEARIDLMEAATRDAKARAEKIASAAGGEVGAIREARMGVIQVVALNSTNVSDYGMYDTSTRDKEVIAVVKVSFAVD